MALYLMGIYADDGESWFQKAWQATGKSSTWARAACASHASTISPSTSSATRSRAIPVDEFIAQYERSRP